MTNTRRDHRSFWTSRLIESRDPAGNIQASQTVNTSLGWIDTFDGSDNPSWRQNIRDQVSATTNYDGTKTTIKSVPFIDSLVVFQSGSSTAVVGNPENCFPGIPVPGAPLGVISSVSDRAYSDLIKKAKAQLSSFESGQDLGEIKETIQSILHPMKSLRDHTLSYFSSVKKLKSRYKKASSLRKAVADTYLEWTFGWKPLAADIADGIVGLGSARLPNVPIDAFAKSQYQHDVSTVDSSGPSGGGMIATLTDIGVFSCRLKGMVNVYYNGGPPSLQQELQLDLPNFLPTAWDLIPYSFVVDYFTNVGDIVNAISFPSAAMRWAWSTTKDLRNCVQIYSDAGLGFFNPLVRTFSSTNFEIESATVSRRYIIPGNYVPSLQFSLPLSSKPWENIGALIASSTKSLTPLW